MAVLCEHHLRELRNPDMAKGGRLYDAQVEGTASKIVEGLSWRRLDELEAKTHEMLPGAADPDFWRLVLRKIEVQKAIVKLNAVHEIVLKNRLELFRKRQREEAAKAQAEVGGDSDVEEDLDPDWEGEEEEVEEDDVVESYDPSMSPRPVDVTRLGDDARLPTLTHSDYLAALFAARRKVSSVGYAPPKREEIQDTDAATERHWRARIAAESAHLDEDEGLEDMDGDADLAEGLPASYDWGDKYRPRKPRYYNRVHTGYEWTSYNKGHYDKDNPPPKIVMGYRFHIFYPDLIDKSTPPSYDRVPVPGDDGTELLVFRAGPPYEDVAFRIVRKQWDYSHRRGFRSHFDRGVLQRESSVVLAHPSGLQVPARHIPQVSGAGEISSALSSTWQAQMYRFRCSDETRTKSGPPISAPRHRQAARVATRVLVRACSPACHSEQRRRSVEPSFRADM
jgi:hypothetical protein